MSAEATPNPNTNNSNLSELSVIIDFGNTNHAIVFFDLETSGFDKTCDVLQIAARHQNTSFSKYIQPNHTIPETASKINGLTNYGQDMFFHGKKVSSHPLQIVLEEFLQFLINCDKKCILVAHNCNFDALRLVRIINQVSLKNDFLNVIDGFADTLPLFKRKYPRADCKLKTLAARNFSVKPEKMHEATYDVLILQNLVVHHFTVNELLSKIKTFIKMVDYPQNFESFKPLESCVSEKIRRRMAYEGINYDNILNMHYLGTEKVIELLEKKDSDGKNVIGTKKIKNDILNHLQTLDK